MEVLCVRELYKKRNSKELYWGIFSLGNITITMRVKLCMRAS